MQGALCISPIMPTPGFRVLDVGTGTGIWAIKFASANPSTQVIGTDLSAIQPTTSVPANCRFLLANAEKEWDFPEPFDFIHSRMLFSGTHDWPSYFRRCYTNLKSGGWVEAQELNLPFHCDDGTAAPDSGLMRWGSLQYEATTKAGLNAAAGYDFKDYMLSQGFTNVQEKVLHWPCTPWPEDEAGKKLGMMQKPNILLALEGATMNLFMNQLGWSKEDVHSLLQEVREDLDDLGKHVYFRM